MSQSAAQKRQDLGTESQDQAKEKGKKAASKLWGVVDSNAESGKERVHDVIAETYTNGRPPKIVQYKLNSQKPTPMPVDHAMRFLKDPAFIVTNEDDEIVEPVKATPESELGNRVLPPDELIVNVTELHDEALFKRAKILPGGDKITEESTREEMIDFIVDFNSQSHQSGTARGSENVIRENKGLSDALLGAE